MKKRMDGVALRWAAGAVLALVSVAGAQTVFESVGLAAALGTPADVRATVNAGHDVDARDGLSVAPLVVALMVNTDVGVAEELLLLGADVNVRNDAGMTPLMFAAQGHETPEWIELLLAYGADPSIRDNNGDTAADHLRQNAALRSTRIADLVDPARTVAVPPSTTGADTRSGDADAAALQPISSIWSQESTRAVITEREQLKSDYGDVVVFLRSDDDANTAYAVLATIPARFPNPEQPVRVDVVCRTGAVEATESQDWQAWLDLTGATLDGTTFSLRDIEVTCFDDERVVVQTASIHRTVALVDLTRQAEAARVWTANAPYTGRPPSYYLSFGFGDFGWVTTAAPSSAMLYEPGGTRPTTRVAFRSDGTVVGFNFSAEVIGVDMAGATHALRFQDEEYIVPYNFQDGPIQMFVKVRDVDEWSYLAIDAEQGSITWRRSSESPR